MSKSFKVIAVLLAIFSIWGCLKLPDNKGRLVVNLHQLKSIPNTQVVAGTISIQRTGRVLQKSFSCPVSEIVFEGIEEGLWLVSVQLMDDKGYVIYIGSQSVVVEANKNNYCDLILELNSADLLLNVTVQSDNVDSLLIDLICGDITHSEQKNLQDNAAIFNFNDLKSAVWDVKFTLFSQQATVLTVPQSGFYGLELQPGRTNSFNVTIDRFGNLNVEVSLSVLNPVSDATLTNLEEGIKIHWQPVEGAVAYDLYRKSGDFWLKLNSESLTQCTFTDTDVVEGETYDYVINAKSTDGLHSGFSKIFSIRRDTKRIFVGIDAKKLYRLRATSTGFEVVKQTTFLDDPGSLITIGDELYVSARNYLKMTKLDSTDFDVISTMNSNTFVARADFNNEYLFAVNSNALYRVKLSDFQIEQFDASGLNSVSADELLCTNTSTVVQLREVENPAVVIAELPGSIGYTVKDLLFVYSNQTMSFYRYTGTLTHLGSVTLPDDPKCVSLDSEGKYAYVGTFSGFSVIDLQTMTKADFSMSLLRALMVFDKELFVTAGKTLYLYDLTNPISPALKVSYSFSENCSESMLFID